MGKAADRAPDALTVRSLEECLKWPGIPRRLAVALQRPILETEAIVAMRRLLRGDGVLVVLSGQAGCGKSLAAAWACAVTPGAAYLHASSLQGMQSADVDEATKKRLTWPRVVCIDDVGTEYNSEKRYAATRIEAAVVER